MKKIALTQGKFAVVDDGLYEALSATKWHYKPSPGTHENGYAIGRPLKNKRTFMHALIMGVPNCQVDHIDGDGLNNRRANLRLATASKNGGNARKQLKNTSSSFKGVNWDRSKNKWYAHIRVNRKMKNLGRFDDEMDAARAYNKAATEAFGEFAKLNEVIP